MRRKVIAGNWKMNGTLAETESLIRSIKEANPDPAKALAIVCPPHVSLETAARLLKGSAIALGAQNMSQHEKGAFTGEVSSAMLLTVGVSFCILGHSERRQFYGETDDLVKAKAHSALAANIKPIVCVGELLEDREAGRTEEVVGRQLDGSLAGFSAGELKNIIIAYEPVWAIGTGKSATPQMAQEVHAFIRARLAAIDESAAAIMPILYGGSMKPGNAADLLSEPDIDGGLIGGAALKAEDFVAIINAL